MLFIGWSSVTNARGRLVVSVNNGANAGLTVGTAYSNMEIRTHTHSFTNTVTLNKKGM